MHLLRKFVKKRGSMRKVKVTLSMTKEAQDVMLDNGYAGVRGMGEFVSRLVLEYHAEQLKRQMEYAQAKAALLRPLAPPDAAQPPPVAGGAKQSTVRKSNGRRHR
jgi:hypothetical protein